MANEYLLDDYDDIKTTVGEKDIDKGIHLRVAKEYYDRVFISALGSQIYVGDGTAPPVAFSGGGPPTGAAGGVLSGNYPNPTFAADMATQAELDALASATTTALGLKANTSSLGTAAALNSGTSAGNLPTVAQADARYERIFLVTALKTSAYAAAANEFVPVDTTGGTFAVSLVAAPADGTVVSVKWSVGTAAPTVTCGGSDVINLAGGSTSAAFAVVNQVFTFRYRAASAIWYVESSISKGGLDSLYAPITPTYSALTPTTGAITLDFAAMNGLYWGNALSGNPTYSASNLSAGRSTTIFVAAGASTRTLTFNASWVFVGSKPTAIAANKLAVLTLTSLGTTDAGVVAAWSVQA